MGPAFLLVAIALGVTPTSAPPSPVKTLDDVLALVRAGEPAAEVAARVAASGAYLPLTSDQVVKLYFDGVPAPVLAAVLSTTGELWPKLEARPGEIELLYDGFRILGRPGSPSPRLIVSGYARDGSRLKAPVEEPSVATARPAPPPVPALAPRGARFEPVDADPGYVSTEPPPVRPRVSAPQAVRPGQEEFAWRDTPSGWVPASSQVVPLISYTQTAYAQVAGPYFTYTQALLPYGATVTPVGLLYSYPLGFGPLASGVPCGVTPRNTVSYGMITSPGDAPQPYFPNGRERTRGGRLAPGR